METFTASTTNAILIKFYLCLFSSIATMATNCQKVEFRKRLNQYQLAPRIMNCLRDAPTNSVSTARTAITLKSSLYLMSLI